MSFDPNKPRSRDEVLLQAIVSGDSTPIGDPRDREEEFVKAISEAGGNKLSKNWFEAIYKNSSSLTVSGNSTGELVFDLCTNATELREFLGDRTCYGMVISYNCPKGAIILRSVFTEPYDSEINSTGSFMIRVRNATSSSVTIDAESSGAHLIYYK